MRSMESDRWAPETTAPFSAKHHVVPEFGQRHPAQGRPDHGRDVELDGVERDGVRHVLFVHQRRDERLVGGAAEGLREAGDERAGTGCARPAPREDSTSSVRVNAVAIWIHCDPSSRRRRSTPVGQHAAKQGEQKDGDAGKERVQPQQEGGVAELVDQPALRHDLHPRADARSARPEPHEPEVAILKRFEDPAKHSGS